jgi:hypothetical protein
MALGWQKLIPAPDLFHGAGNYRIDAYSEFLPAPRVGWKPYGDGAPDPELFSEDDPYGWHINEFDEELELRAGLVQVGKQLIPRLVRLLGSKPNSGLHKLKLAGNPYWPEELATESILPHERCVTLLPLSLSRTQDDKGRIRWTLFGGSEQGPGKAFWKSFYTAPRKELPTEHAVSFLTALLKTVYGEVAEGVAGLKKAGFRILPDDELLPQWTAELLLPAKPTATSAKYLLTFRPYGQLPGAVRRAYLAGKLHLLPFPGSLIYWGIPGYEQLAEELPFAQQIPLLMSLERHRRPGGLRVPQAGYLHEPTAAQPLPHHHAELVRNSYQRTHRWDKILRDEDELALLDKKDKLLHVLFSTLPDDLTLYDKPMARNVQLWTEDYQLLLDGPNATSEQIKKTMRIVQSGGLFGYRFQFPAMQVGKHEVYWHRPLVAYRGTDGEAVVLTDSPTGYMTAYEAARPKLNRAIELWPRYKLRPVASFALQAHSSASTRSAAKILNPVSELLDTFEKRGRQPLPVSFAGQVVRRGSYRSLDKWITSLHQPLAGAVRVMLEPDVIALPRRRGAKVPDSLTYRSTANRRFEVAYWKLIAALSEGTFVNKNNADCVRDAVTLKLEHDHERHLERLGDHLLGYYARKITAAKMTGKALAGSLPFQWRTDFDYSWMGGWLKNQESPAERNLIVVIPGRNRKQAVVMADHYDTAYMADRYYAENSDQGARLAACGADDNHSATSAMMLAAPIFLKMSREGQLACDIWLIHLTGEEFPADCLGARALTERLVERSLQMTLPDGKVKDLSGVTVRGLYVSDMIAHNNDHERDIFQIAPGQDNPSLKLAEEAHMAAEIWNESVPVWNQSAERRGKSRSRRSLKGDDVPEVAPFLALSGEVRTTLDPRSTLYNTDGQIFSDAGVPCVLFMENYDINRTGYHDMHDTMENIDLDYGSALCAITIETVARVASGKW